MEESESFHQKLRAKSHGYVSEGSPCTYKKHVRELNILFEAQLSPYYIQQAKIWKG
jgi:hypothetical protein